MTSETDPLLILIPQEEAPSAPLQTLEPPYNLEIFILDILHRSGVWESHRVSNGIAVWRIVERDPSRVRITGRIYEISQPEPDHVKLATTDRGLTSH